MGDKLTGSKAFSIKSNMRMRQSFTTVYSVILHSVGNNDKLKICLNLAWVQLHKRTDAVSHCFTTSGIVFHPFEMSHSL